MKTSYKRNKRLSRPLLQRIDRGITTVNGRLRPRKRKVKLGRKTAGVLGKETLAAIRKDMVKLILPTWVDIAPRNPGQTDQGKFKADEWQAFCTINLPITLIRLWSSSNKDDRKHKMLINFMHLVTAVRLANMREMTEARIHAFEVHIRLYLHGLQELYPHTEISIYQHSMLHFGSLLRRFGPVHSWRCFAFERMNYVLQQINTNGKLGVSYYPSLYDIFSFCQFDTGDLENTMFRKMCMAQKLRAIFHGTSLPPHLLSLASLFEECFERNTLGTRITDILAWETEPESVTKVAWNQSKLKTVDANLLQAVQSLVEKSTGPIDLSPEVWDRARVQWRDLTFTTQTFSFADAQVVFKSGTLEGWKAGSIQRIFTARWSGADNVFNFTTFAQINVYSPLSRVDRQYDIYRNLGFAGGRLFYNHFEDKSIVLPLESIASHFGFSIQDISSSISTETFHALPLNKVSFGPPILKLRQY